MSDVLPAESTPWRGFRMSTKSRQGAISGAKSPPGAFSENPENLKARQVEISQLKSRPAVIWWTF